MDEVVPVQVESNLHPHEDKTKPEESAGKSAILLAKSKDRKANAKKHQHCRDNIMSKIYRGKIDPQHRSPQ